MLPITSYGSNGTCNGTSNGASNTECNAEGNSDSKKSDKTRYIFEHCQFQHSHLVYGKLRQ